MNHRIPAVWCALLLLAASLASLSAQTTLKGSKLKPATTPTPSPAAGTVAATPAPADPQTLDDLLSGVGQSIDDAITREDPALVALGSMGASNLYYCYLTLGAIADGFVNGNYQAKVVISVANEAIFMNQSSKDALAKLGATGLMAQSDLDLVKYLVETYDILTAQAKALVRFVSDRSDDGSEYQAQRKEAWKRIVWLFGIK